mmetsp:Transcript_79655/g.174670  ORF Transcript_79655/g.174670 Transcript_79655/m.174670 type:complete len:202 (-) Transcript_79655:227-832(-)
MPTGSVASPPSSASVVSEWALDPPVAVTMLDAASATETTTTPSSHRAHSSASEPAAATSAASLPSSAASSSVAGDCAIMHCANRSGAAAAMGDRSAGLLLRWEADEGDEETEGAAATGTATPATADEATAATGAAAAAGTAAAVGNDEAAGGIGDAYELGAADTDAADGTEVVALPLPPRLDLSARGHLCTFGGRGTALGT